MALLTTQEQKQIVSAAMKQSLYVLSLPAQSLQEYINDLATENPLIELDERYGDIEAARQSVPQNVEQDLSGEAFQSWKSPRMQKERGTTLDVGDHAAAEETFIEHLLNQLNQDATLPKEYLPICCFIVESLNSRGYLEDPIEELAEMIHVSAEDAMQALYVVQSLSPTGVGARDLQECLILQLAEGKDFNSYTLSIVKNHLQLLAKGNINGIAKALHVPAADAERYCAVIRNLNPIPSRGFYAPDDNRYVVPDAVVEMADGKMVVKYNDSILSHISINRDYCKMLKESGDAEAMEYLQKSLRQAEKAKADLRSRENTLVRVIEYVVTMQQAYIRGEEQAPALLTISDVAEKLDFHVSTISRAVKDKYIMYQNRTVRLKDLFSTPISNAVSVSRPAVMKQLKYLVDTEDKSAPLSDEKLKERLLASGIDISRRTIAVYREELNIPCASARRIK